MISVAVPMPVGFVMPPTTDPATALVAIEAALPEYKREKTWLEV